MRKTMLTLIGAFALVTMLTHTGCTTYNGCYIGDDGELYPYYQLPSDISESNVPKDLK